MVIYMKIIYNNCIFFLNKIISFADVDNDGCTYNKR